MKIAIYARVSTEEQARSGLSIDTQLDNLRSWAKENDHVIVDEYVDRGVSARKSPVKRPELQRLLGDLGRFDAVVFTKLDRWTRNIKGYYQVQEQLDAHNVAWIAVQEDYETVTSAGRFKVNIMLAIAESEADRTSERIKVVFEGKVARGEHLGNPIPFGYSKSGKSIVPSEDADLVRAVFRIYRQTGSVYKAKDYLHEHGHPFVYPTVYKMLHNPIYTGRYRDNLTYCEPIISPGEFADAQKMLEKRSVRRNPTKNVYLFSGLMRCSVCGHSLGGNYVNARVSLRYRCPYHAMNGRCSNAKNYREIDIESWLLDNIAAELQKVTADPQRKKKKGPDRAAIAAKLDRLKDLYVDGMITKEQYTADREKILSQMPEENTSHLSAARRIVLASDFRERYNELPREDKRALWRSIVDHIDADGQGNLSIYFSP